MTEERFFLIWILLGGLFQTSFADVPVAAYLRNLSNYDVRQNDAITEFAGRDKVGVFGMGLLEEFGLKSYSRWEIASTKAKVRPEGSGWDLEVYELLDAPGAFGLFSLWEKIEKRKLDTRVNLPIEHKQAGSELIFWRNNFFLYVHDRTGQPTAQGLEPLVRDMLDAIPPINALPVAVAHLPQEDLREGSVEFYLGRNSLALNEEFPKQLIPIVGFQDRIEIGMGRYEPRDTPLFVIAYPTPAVADNYSVKIQHALASYFGEPPVYLKRSGLLIGLCLSSEEDAVRLLSRLNYKAKVKWLEEDKEIARQDIGFLGVVYRALLGTLAFLAITLVLGLGAGYIRYLVIRRYPHVGNREETIRLKLDK